MLLCLFKKNKNIMKLFRGLLRKFQSKGHFIHSPFAFNLITNVLNSPYIYYAFSDIEQFTWTNKSFFFENEPESEQITKYNLTSFRLVNHINPKNILEINSGTSLNSLFILDTEHFSDYTLFEIDKNRISKTKEIIDTFIKKVVYNRFYKFNHSINFSSELESLGDQKFDAVFVNEGKIIPDYENLFKMSGSNTFWVINGITKDLAKQFWRKIVNDKRVRVTFEMKDFGIAFLDPSYHKANYYI